MTNLPRPIGEPEELLQHAGRLGRVASELTADIGRWGAAATGIRWSGPANTLHTDRTAGIEVDGRSMAESCLQVSAHLRTFANRLKSAQQAIDQMQRRLSDLYDRVGRLAIMARRTRDEADRLRMAAITDPMITAAAEMAEDAATVAHRRFDAAQDEADRVRRRQVSLAEELVDEIRSYDRLSARRIDETLPARTDVIARNATTAVMATVPPISARYRMIRDRINRHLASVSRSIAAIEAVPVWDRTFSEHLALRSLRHDYATHVAFTDPNRQILEWSPDGDGRVAEVFGDLNSARHIAVMVPGMMNTSENFDNWLAAPSRRLWNEARSNDEDVAVVAWLGYDTPGLHDSVVKTSAKDAQGSLRAFVASLNPDVHSTVVAHSYGSVVAGEAASNGLDVDDLILVGSPGTSLETAGQARLRPGGQVWAAVSDNDFVGRAGWGSPACPELTIRTFKYFPILTIPIRYALDSCQVDADGDVLGLSHGTNPAHESFGASELPSGGVEGHSSYFDTDSSSLEAIANVVTGRATDGG